MNKVIAIISLLHEPAERSSATRLFRGEPVLRWTLRRLSRARRVSSAAILCWDDQLDALRTIAERAHVDVRSHGTRQAVPQIESVAAAQRWADGWRGGLLGTCHFDLGFYAPWHYELATTMNGDAIVLIDPSAGLVDPVLVDSLVEHAEANESQDLCFAPAAPGLGAALMRTGLVNRLAAAGAHGGRLMHYHPDQLSREPLAGEGCAPVPAPVARTTRRFALDSDRQLQLIAAATAQLNGQLVSTGAEELVRRVQSIRTPDEFPREIVLELNTNRSTRPTFWPGSTLAIERPGFSLELAKRLLAEISSAGADDLRLTLAGVGDPMLSDDVFTIIDAARLEAGASVHLETDLHQISPERVARLVAAPVDVVSVHLPALSAQTYAKVMGSDAYLAVIENIRRFVAERQARRSGVPILAPVFTKCADNLGEMEAWYDQWLRAVGSAVIRGPSDCAGQIPDRAVADMAPPGRKACARLASRVTILSDGRIVSCEEDVLGRQVMGRLGSDSLREVWRQRFDAIRSDHARGDWDKNPLCKRCREWHRP